MISLLDSHFRDLIQIYHVLHELTERLPDHLTFKMQVEVHGMPFDEDMHMGTFHVQVDRNGEYSVDFMGNEDFFLEPPLRSQPEEADK